MAITPDVTTVTVDGVIIGLSDTIGTLISNGDFTVENLTPYMFCGQLNYVTPKFSSLTGAEKIYSGSAGSAPLYFPNVNTGSLGGVTVEFAINDNPTFTNDLYGRNVLLYDTGRVESIHNDSTGMTARVVTSIDFKKIYYDVDAANIPITTGRPAETIGCYVSGAAGTVKTVDNDVDTLIKVYSIVETDSTWYCILDNMFPASDTDGYSHICSSWQYMQGNFDTTYESLNYCLDSFDKTKSMFKYAVSSNYEIYGGEGGNWNNSFTSYVDITEDVYSYMDYTSLNYSANFHCYIKTLNGALEQLARAGLKFKWNNTWYKPIGEGGYITGYTDDMTEESDWDDIVDVTGNIVPVTPPGPTPPTPSDDDMDTMATGATGSSGGFTHFYIMSPQDLIDLLADFYTRADPGETLSNNLVCSYILGIPSSEFCATENVPVAIHNSAQGTPFVSQANYAHVTATNNLLVVGSFDVPRRTNTFYDFSPYSTYEVFIPCCGWVPLPDTVAGRKIYVEMYIDIASCCVKAAVKISGDGVCAVANGVLGASIPMAVIESGILRGNNIQAGLGIISGGINTGIGAGNGNALGIGFGVQQILSGLIDCTVAGNTNYTQQKGGTGDITQFAMGHECYLKVTHPELDPVVNESIFGHSVGYLCNSIGKLETFKGFTVCGNPHVTFSASAEEREEIERLLSIGVIL